MQKQLLCDTEVKTALIRLSKISEVMKTKANIFVHEVKITSL